MIPDRSEILKTWEKITEDIYIDRTNQIGRGLHGQVYKGYSDSKKQLIAIKYIKLGDTSSQRQVKTLKDLSSLDHSNIMGYYDSLIKDNHQYIFIEYCPNGTLQNFLKKKLSQLQVLRLFRQLVEGMCYMNSKNKMHRDLKPQNILIGPQNNIKICDFGLSQSSNNANGMFGSFAYPYIAPQVIKSKLYTNKCDVWSTGIILYQMLTGQLLIKESLEEQWLMFERGLKKAEYSKQFHPLWQYFTNWMLNVYTNQRPTFHQVLQTLKKVYPKMEAQLQNGNKMIKTPELQRLEAYISFQIQKYQMFLDLYQIMKNVQFTRLCHELKYLIMFLCLLRYIIFTKRFLRDLEYKRIQYDQQDLIINYSDIEVEIFLNRYRFIIEHRLEFYYQQHFKQIISKILNTYRKSMESMATIQGLVDVLQMVKNLKDGYMVFNENSCANAMKSMLPIIQKRCKKDIQYFNIEELRIYQNILVVILIDEQLPTQQFHDANIVKNLQSKLKLHSKQQLIKEINILKKYKL